MKGGWTPRAKFDDAQEALRTAEAQVESAQAQLRIAEDRLGYTVLRADSPGAVTATGADAGEVVKAGQTIVQLAGMAKLDAVFDIPEQLIRTGPRDPVVVLALSDASQVQATGYVRQVAPQADSNTRTFQVKVGINNPPEGMKLGSTVTGRIKLAAPAGIAVPASALTEGDSHPAVWVVDRQSRDRVAAPRRRHALRRGRRRDLAGAREGRCRGHRRRADAASGPEGPPAGRRLMKSFNLSEWALRHRSLVTYFMLMIVIAGIGRLLQARPQRGSRLHRQDHGGGRGVARRDGPRHPGADHRPAGAQAAGDAKPRLRQELYQRRPRHDLREPEGLHAARRRAGHLVPGPQEGG